jgi:hypothetical protein
MLSKESFSMKKYPIQRVFVIIITVKVELKLQTTFLYWKYSLNNE